MRAKHLGLMGMAIAALAAGGAALADEKPLTERGKTVESAVTTPIEDLNIKRTKIPEVLQRAQANPYDLATTPTCETLAHEISLLNTQLGDDHDDKVMDQTPEDGSKGPSAGALLKAGVAQAIPFRGIVRQVSGAAAHDEAVDKAIDAGFARRGFLKGRALEMNCSPGAAPAWFTPRPEKDAETRKAETPIMPEAPTTTQVAAAPHGLAEATTAAVETASAARPTIEAAPLPILPGATEAVSSPRPEPGTLDAQLAERAAGIAAPPPADPL